MHRWVATIVTVLLIFGSAAHAQEAQPSCATSLRYTDGSVIDPQGLRVGASVTDGTFTVPVYPGMTPESICNFLGPMRTQVTEALRRAGEAERLRADAVTQAGNDRAFREKIEKSFLFRDPPLLFFVVIVLALIVREFLFFLIKLSCAYLRHRKRRRGDIYPPPGIKF